MTLKIDGKFKGKLTCTSKTDMRTLVNFHQSTQKSNKQDFTGTLCVMTAKNDAKFEEELTCRFKIDTRNLTNFDPSIIGCLID